MQPDWTLFRAMLHCPYKAWQFIKENKNNIPASFPANPILQDKIALAAARYEIEKPTKHVGRVEKLLADFKVLMDKQDPPAFYKNAHCSSCGFWKSCQQKLKEKDCISLLPAMPNTPVTITSWSYEKAKGNPNLNLIDNRAIDILCYDPRYTFVEKLQTIANKFRKEMETEEAPTNYMRQYYDVYSQLADSRVQAFIGSEEYNQNKKNGFPKEDFAIPINENQAFLLDDSLVPERLIKHYEGTRALY